MCFQQPVCHLMGGGVLDARFGRWPFGCAHARRVFRNFSLHRMTLYLHALAREALAGTGQPLPPPAHTHAHKPTHVRACMPPRTPIAKLAGACTNAAGMHVACTSSLSRSRRTRLLWNRRVSKFSPYGSVCYSCAQRPGLPRACHPC